MKISPLANSIYQMRRNHIKTFRITGMVFLSLYLGGCNFLPQSFADAISGASKKMATNGNSLFHQTDVVILEEGLLEISGEVKAPGMVDLENHYKREVFIKEALFDNETGINFIGAYRYRGYSLFDILHPFNQEKKNAEAFRPAIDLYVVIENDLGETVVFSWSEIFHTNNPHQILIASEAAPIVPYRKEVDYSMGEKWKVVAANDLFAFRVLENPVKITVRSFDKKDYPINRDHQPMYSHGLDVVLENKLLVNIVPEENPERYIRYYSSFYGMGMGYHEAKYFQGPLLQTSLWNHLDLFNPGLNRNALVCFASVDGYRAIFSFSELFNRTDQVFPILAVPDNPNDGGFYRIFHPAEFYADRSVKSVKEMYIFMEN
jgi:hypothetical protein